MLCLHVLRVFEPQRTQEQDSCTAMCTTEWDFGLFPESSFGLTTRYAQILTPGTSTRKGQNRLRRSQGIPGPLATRISGRHWAVAGPSRSNRQAGCAAVYTGPGPSGHGPRNLGTRHRVVRCLHPGQGSGHTARVDVRPVSPFGVGRPFPEISAPARAGMLGPRAGAGNGVDWQSLTANSRQPDFHHGLLS
jgi:hypothetical protein